MAEPIIRRVLSYKPDSAITRFTLGLILLKQGKLAEGWNHYAARWALPQSGTLPKWAPRWFGKPLHGKTIILTWEQGYGDLWQFVRYAKTIKARYPTCTLCIVTRHGTRSMLESMRCFDRIYEDGDSFGDGFPVDYICPVMDLAPGCGIMRVKDIDGSPYIRKPEPLPLVGSYKVGLCWSGNPQNRKDAWRSIPWSVFSRLLGVHGVTYYSVGNSDSRGLPEIRRTPDWMDTARGLAALDLLITLDTGTAHLAGAMGIQTWMFVQLGGDFRWFMKPERTSWYNSMRLFRNGQDRDWLPVVDRVRSMLKSKVRPKS